MPENFEKGGIMAILLSLGMLIAPVIMCSCEASPFDDPGPECEHYIHSVNTNLLPDDRLYEMAEYYVIYFSGKFKPKNSLARQLSKRISCLDIGKDSVEISEIKSNFFLPYDPDLTTPENEAYSIIHERADWLRDNNLIFDNREKMTNILGLHVLMFGIPVQITAAVSPGLDICSHVEKLVVFPNGEKREYCGSGPGLTFVFRDAEEMIQAKQKLELFIPKGFHSLKNAVFAGIYLLPCPELSSSEAFYFDQEWQHFRLLADIFLDQEKFKSVNDTNQVQIIFSIYQPEGVCKSDTIDIAGQIGDFIRYAPNWSLPLMPEAGDYIVTTVVWDKITDKRFEQINRFNNSNPFNCWIGSQNYLYRKLSLLDYFIPITSPHLLFSSDDQIIMPLRNVPALPSGDRRQIIITAYFNRYKPGSILIEQSDDMIVSYDINRRANPAEIDLPVMNDIDETKNLVAFDTI
jgi:hypothetical protein